MGLSAKLCTAIQIKRNLIEKARLKKDYAKVKAHQPTQPAFVYSAEDEEDHASPAIAAPEFEPTTEPHPARQTLISEQAIAPEKEEAKAQPTDPALARYEARRKRPKAVPFAREHRQALRSKTEAEERRKAREEAERQRQIKIEEREKFRRAMAKARTGGKNGQRKLGRESNVLLEKVKRMVAER